MDRNLTDIEVLLVEDDPVDARLLRRSLAGATVAEHVGTLADAITWLETERADVVLLDLGLPDAVGLATLEGLLAAHTATPVVVLSGADDDEQASAAVEAGAQEYLVKGSVDGQVMRRTLRHAVERHRLETELRERAKEMAGLYAITHELQPDQGLDQAVEVIAARLRESMRWPDVCRVTATIDEASATAGPDGGDDRPRLTAAIHRGDEICGQLEVRYVADRPFLVPHEQDLLDATAHTIEVWLAREDSAHRLRRSEEQLRVLVSQLPGLLWTADTELRTTSYGGALLAELGIGPDDLIGVPVVDVLESDPPELTLDLLQQALAGTASTFERSWRGRWFRNHVEPKRGEDGEVTGVVCLSLDVTEEKAHVAELAQARAHLEGLFLNASEGMILADDDGRLVDANPAACELTGYTRDELLDMHMWDVSADDVDDAEHRARWRELVAAGSMAGEHVLRRRDGSTVETEFRAVANIAPGMHLSVLRDITSRRQAEEALAASEERFRTMAESAQDAMYRVRIRPTYEAEYINPAAAAITGFPVEEFRVDGRLYLSRAHPEDVHLLDPCRLQPGRTETVTVRIRHADGHWVWVEDSRSPIVEGGEIVGMQGVVRDVTSRRRIQDALQEALEAERRASDQLRSADRLKSHFLQAVSHELRTPLTAVLGLSATLVDRGSHLDDAATSYFHERVLANARKLDGLLGDLLDLERLEHGAVRLDRSDTDLPALVTRVAQDIEFGGRELVLPDGPVLAHVDAPRVERIVHNLLSNAVKHTPPGTRITVRCAMDRDTDTAVLEVADDGPGVPGELALAIFEPFRQGPRSYESASPGTGIGLSIVRQFAALHGGTAWVHETPGGGATFTVRLPTAAEHDQATPLIADPGTDHAAGTGPGPAPTPVAGAETIRQGEPAVATAAAAVSAATVSAPTARAVPNAAAVTAWATRQLLTADTKEEIVGVLLQVVHQLGGWTIPARVADEQQALPIDISLGTSEPLLPAAEPASVERMLLERHLPQLMADARHAADTIVQTDRLVEAATTDGLTRLPDRSRFERLRARMRTHDIVVTFHLEDLDAVNDAHGHAAGDEVLRAFAACLRDVLRAEDEAARLGGDEFAVLLRDTDADGVAVLLERLDERWARQRPQPVAFLAEVTDR